MNQIEIQYEGKMLVARPVFVNPADVVAILIEPKELSGIMIFTSHIPAFAMGSGVFVQDGILTEKAIFQLHHEMIGLYKAHHKLFKRIDEIRECVVALYKAMEPCFSSENVISNEDFYKLRSELKKELKNRILSNRDYESKLTLLKKGSEKWHSIICHIENSITMIMQYMISDNVDEDTLLQLIVKYGIWADENYKNKYNETIKLELNAIY